MKINKFTLRKGRKIIWSSNRCRKNINEVIHPFTTLKEISANYKENIFHLVNRDNLWKIYVEDANLVLAPVHSSLGKVVSGDNSVFSEPNLLSHLLKKKMNTSTTQWFVLILVSEAVSSPFLPQLSNMDFGYKMLENLMRIKGSFKIEKMVAFIQILVT